MPNQMLIDPTRTITLRKKWMADFNRRFARLMKEIYQLIVVDDAFGLNEKKPLKILALQRQWEFLTDSKKVTAFEDWLKVRVDTGILEVDKQPPWTNDYVSSAYRKGMVRAYTDGNKLGSVPAGFQQGSQAEFLRSAFAQPETISKIQTIYTRAYSQLKGIGAVTDQQLSRVLADGLVAGQSTRQIARNIENTIGSINRTRARVLARTEVVSAHAEAQLDTYEQLGIAGAATLAEWQTAGAPCPLCAPMDGVIIKIDEARGAIPRHPNCLCMWIPAGVEDKKGSTPKRSAIGKSVAAEGGKAKSRWKLRERGSAQAGRTRAARSGTFRTPASLPKAAPARAHPALEPISAANVDKYGTRLGTKNARINEFLSGTDAVRVTDIANKTGQHVSVVSGHLNRLLKAGKVKRTSKGYVSLIDDIKPVKVRPVVPAGPTKPVGVPGSGLDGFGTRLGSKGAEMNKLLDFTKPLRVRDVKNKLGYSYSEASTHLKRLLKNGKVVKTPDGYVIATKHGTKISPIAPAPKHTGVTKFTTAEDYRLNVIKAFEEAEDNVKADLMIQRWKKEIDDLVHNLAQKEMQFEIDMDAVTGVSGLAKSAAKRKLTAKYNASIKEMYDRRWELAAKLSERRKSYRLTHQKMRALLAEDDNYKGLYASNSDRGELFGTLKTAERKAVDDMLSMIPEGRLTMRQKEFLQTIQIKREVGEGTFYRNSQMLINMDDWADSSAFVHEWGHHFSYQVTEAMKAQNVFYKARTVGDKIQKWPDINVGRGVVCKGKPDNFKVFTKYAGRVYSDGHTPEVFSVGCEYIFKDPYKAATLDADWFNLIIGQLKGIPAK